MKNNFDPFKYIDAIGERVPEKYLHETVKVNYDPIPKEVYDRMFAKLLRSGDTLLNLASGPAIDITGVMNFLNESLKEASENIPVTVIPIDINLNKLRTYQAYNEIHDDGQNLLPIQASVLSLPVGNDSVSGITSSNFINCPHEGITLTEQAKVFLREAWRVIRPGGFVLITSFGYLLIGQDQEGRKVYNDNLTDTDLLSLSSIEQILVETGFTDIRHLDIDDNRPGLNEVIEEQDAWALVRSREAGGFLAFKPKK